MPTITQTSVSQSPLTKEKILEVYGDVFDGLGTFPCKPYKFRLKENYVPARHAPRKVLMHLQDDFHAEIHDLIKQGVLEKVEHSTEWVNSFVIVEKHSRSIHTLNHKFKKKLWICLDPRDLNKALKHEPYYSWSVDELIAKFHRCKVFSIIDMKKGYWMVPLHPESRPLTRMSIDIGRYQLTWLPMGTNVASDVYQKKLDEIFHNLQGITGIAGDMISYRKSWEEHDVHCLNFLSIVRKNNLQLNASKLQFQLEEVSFFGHKWNSKGISPDPKKIYAIEQMVFPSDKESIQSFLGMIKFLNRYSPWLSELSTALRELCRIHAEYKPKSEHHESCDAIRREPSMNIVLPYYDPTSHTTLQTDSSKKGLRAVLIQHSTPIYFASRAIATTEANYQNLEWDTPATIWGWKNFFTFYMVMNSH